MKLFRRKAKKKASEIIPDFNALDLEQQNMENEEDNTRRWVNK